jgi:small conductance mechanosensitive channel
MDLVTNWLNIILSFVVANILPTALLLVIGIVVVVIIKKIVKTLLEKSKLEKAAHSLINSLVSAALYLLLGLIVASRMGIDVTGIIALASVLTLAISLSVQNMLTNLIGGFTLLTTKPFVSGHFVEIAGQSGVVKEIGLTYTKLHTADNKEVSIPNSEVVSSKIINFTVIGTRRVEVYVSASYDSPIDQVLEALKDAAQVPTVLQEMGVTTAVKNYGESTIEYLLFAWCKSEDYWTTLFAVQAKVKKSFEEKGVEMSYPHINVHMDK